MLASTSFSAAAVADGHDRALLPTPAHGCVTSASAAATAPTIGGQTAFPSW
jgi:hypothetical protein